MNFNDIREQSKKEELEQTDDSYSTISREINEIIANLKKVRSRTEENIASAELLLTTMLEKLSTIDVLPISLIEKSEICDHLMHFLNPPFSNRISCIIHDIFNHIYVSTLECAKIAKNSSYFHYIVDYYYNFAFKPTLTENDGELTGEDIFLRVIHSLRFGIQYFPEIEITYFERPYIERFTYLIGNSSFSEKTIHELICLTDSMIFARTDESTVTFISPILLSSFLDPRYTKVCCDTFIRIVNKSFLHEYITSICVKNAEEKSEKPTDLISLILTVLLTNDSTYDIKAKVKSFVLLRHILYFLQSHSNEVNPSKLTVQIVNVEFLNNIINLFDAENVTKPKHLEMVVYSLLQISLNDPSIPIVICQSNVFEALLNLVNNPDTTYMVGIACRLVFASLLRSEEKEIQIFVFEKCFHSLVDLFESDEQEFIIEAIDAVMSFLYQMNNSGNQEIINKIVNDPDFSWLNDCLVSCNDSSVERIAETANYIISQYFTKDELEIEDKML